MTTMVRGNAYFASAGLKQLNRFVPLFFFSAVVLAGMNGYTRLPESYRTPLSDMVYDENKEWRAEPEEENPWRENEEELILQPRLKAEFFPKYNYGTVDNPEPGSLFQNANEIDKPVSNIFKYTF